LGQNSRFITLSYNSRVRAISISFAVFKWLDQLIVQHSWEMLWINSSADATGSMSGDPRRFEARETKGFKKWA